MSNCAPLEKGMRVKVLLCGDETSLEGVYLAHEDAFGQEFLLLDTGGPEPTRINAGYVVWLQCIPAAPEIPLARRGKLKPAT